MKGKQHHLIGPANSNGGPPRFLPLYKHSRTGLRYTYYLLEESLTGFWLGVLSKDSIHKIDDWFYKDEELYISDEYNIGGLFNWEESVVDKYYSDLKKILLLGAGGGREIYGLQKWPFEITAYECNPRFVAYANAFLSRQSISTPVTFIDRDDCPKTGNTYDGVIIGWGSYMLIQGRKRRISFLRALNKQLNPRSPVLVSFFVNTLNKRRFILATKIANLLRTIRNRELADVGDYLVPNYVHFFTRDEILAEFSEAGFDLAFYSSKPYGHVVGISKELRP